MIKENDGTKIKRHLGLGLFGIRMILIVETWPFTNLQKASV